MHVHEFIGWCKSAHRCALHGLTFAKRKDLVLLEFQRELIFFWLTEKTAEFLFGMSTIGPEADSQTGYTGEIVEAGTQRSKGRQTLTVS